MQKVLQDICYGACKKEKDATREDCILFFLISCTETYASAFSTGITDTERLSALPTLNCTVPSTKAKRVWSLPIPMFSPGWNSVPL